MCMQWLIGILIAVAFLVSPPLGAEETDSEIIVYRAVGADGVIYLGEEPPLDETLAVEVIALDATNPPDYDPAEYEHSILNQARRVEERWRAREELELERQAARARAAPAVQIVEPYLQPYDSYPYYASYPVWGRARAHHRTRHQLSHFGLHVNIGHHSGRSSNLDPIPPAVSPQPPPAAPQPKPPARAGTSRFAAPGR